MANKNPFLNKSPIRVTNVPNVPSGYENLLQIFRSNIMELKFKRRHVPSKKTIGHMKTTRNMLCTADWKLLSNIYLRNLFGWKRPIGNRGPNWYKARNLIIVWDFMKNDFRIVSLDKWTIIATHDTKNIMGRDQFVVFFKKYLNNLSQNKRDGFSDK